jgi:hypothetical protein
MTTRRKAIFTAMQAHPLDKEKGPILFGSNLRGALSYVQGELDWRLFDFCRIHQIVYKELQSVEVNLNEIEIEPFSSDIDDEENINRSRKFDYIIGKGIENERVTGFVDHMTIVGLWAIAEQFLGKIYKAFVSKKNGVSEQAIVAPYKWDDFKMEFNNLRIDLISIESFQSTNECRVLNNSIKHDPTVNSKLSQFPYFTPHSGKELDNVPLEMQRYLNGVSDFLGSLIEKVNAELESYSS